MSDLFNPFMFLARHGINPLWFVVFIYAVFIFIEGRGFLRGLLYLLGAAGVLAGAAVAIFIFSINPPLVIIGVVIFLHVTNKY